MRAIELDEQLDNPKEYAIDYSNLARLYLDQGRLDEAEGYARRAVEIEETLDLSAAPWTTYQILAQIAEARDRAGEAAQWRRKEQESYAAYAGAAHRLPEWAPSFIAAVVAAVEGDESASQGVEEMLPKLENGGYQNLVSPIQRVLVGETDANELCVGLDYEDAYIIRTILAQLAGEAPAVQPPSSSPQREEDNSAAEEEGELAQLRAQWEPVIGAVVAACQGNAQAAEQVESFMAQLAQQGQWGNLAAVLGRPPARPGPNGHLHHRSGFAKVGR